MKFAQIFDGNVPLGSSVRASFSADNVQAILIKNDAANPNWLDLILSVNVGSVFNVARVPLDQLDLICTFNRGRPAGSPHMDSMYIDLGSVWLGTNEEIEIIFDNEHPTHDYDLSVTVVYNGDEPEDIISYQKLVDSNWSRENVEQAWLFGTDLHVNNETVTIQTSGGSETTKIEVFQHYTNSQQNSDVPNENYALIYDDEDDILEKVTATITSLDNISNWIVITNETNPERVAEKNEEYVAKKSAKLAAMNPKQVLLNRLKGRI